MADKAALTRKQLAERWQVTERTIIRYEEDGVIKAMELPTPRYSMAMVLEIEGAGFDVLKPIEKRSLERKIDSLQAENKRLKAMLLEISALGQKAYKEVLACKD